MTVLERDPADHQGCSFGNAGMIVPSHFTPLAAPGMVGYGFWNLWNRSAPIGISASAGLGLYRWSRLFARSANRKHVERASPILRDLHCASRDLFVKFAEESGNSIGLTRRGLLMLCKERRALEDESALASHACSLGVTAERLSPSETAALDPGIEMDIAGSVYFPDDCFLDPARLLAYLRSSLERAGVNLVYDSEVTGWTCVGPGFPATEVTATSARSRPASTQGSDRIAVVKTTKGDVLANQFVLAAGAGSSALGRSLGLDMPLISGKGYSVTAPSPPALPSICSILVEARVAVTPMGSDLRFAGTMDLCGTELSINKRRLHGMFASIPDYLPQMRSIPFDQLPVWTGLRPCSPDGLPYIGRSRQYRNLIIATGHAMMGVSLGPITGKIVAELAAGDRPSVSVTLLDPDRFS